MVMDQQQAQANENRLVTERKAVLTKYHGGGQGTKVTSQTIGGREVLVSQKTGTVVGTSGLTPTQYQEQQAKLSQDLAVAKAQKEVSKVAETQTGRETAGQVVRQARTISQQYGVRDLEVIRELSATSISASESRDLEGYEVDREVMRTQKVRLRGDKVDKEVSLPAEKVTIMKAKEPELTLYPSQSFEERRQELIRKEKAEKFGLFGARKVKVEKLVVEKTKQAVSYLKREKEEGTPKRKAITPFDAPVVKKFMTPETYEFRYKPTIKQFERLGTKPQTLIKPTVKYVKQTSKYVLKQKDKLVATSTAKKVISKVKDYKPTRLKFQERKEITPLDAPQLKKLMTPETYEFQFKPAVAKAKYLGEQTKQFAKEYYSYYKDTPLQATTSLATGLTMVALTRKFPSISTSFVGKTATSTVTGSFVVAKGREFKQSPNKVKFFAKTTAELTAFGVGGLSSSSAVTSRFPVKLKVDSFSLPMKKGGSKTLWRGVALETKTKSQPLVGLKEGSSAGLIHTDKVTIGTPKLSLKGVDIRGIKSTDNVFAVQTKTQTRIFRKSAKGVFPARELRKFDLMKRVTEKTQNVKSKYTKKELSREVKYLEPKLVEETIKFGQEKDGYFYGSWPQKTQVRKGGREPADIDVRFPVAETEIPKLSAELLARYKAKKTEYDYFIDPKKPSLIQTKRGAETHHAVDIHSLGDTKAQGGAMTGVERVYGMDLGQKPIKIEGLDIMPLGEQGIRKGPHSLLAPRGYKIVAKLKKGKNLEESSFEAGFGFAPLKHRLKDVGDYFVVQEEGLIPSVSRFRPIKKAGLRKDIGELKSMYPKELTSSGEQPLLSFKDIKPNKLGSLGDKTTQLFSSNNMGLTQTTQFGSVGLFKPQLKQTSSSPLVTFQAKSSGLMETNLKTGGFKSFSSPSMKRKPSQRSPRSSGRSGSGSPRSSPYSGGRFSPSSSPRSSPSASARPSASPSVPTSLSPSPVGSLSPSISPSPSGKLSPSPSFSPSPSPSSSPSPSPPNRPFRSTSRLRFDFDFDKQKKFVPKKKKKAKWGSKGRYSPSLWAVVGQVKGKKSGGLGLRPIPFKIKTKRKK